jgi:hypothetical protein
MHRHLRPKRSDLFGKLAMRIGAQQLHPLGQHSSRGIEQTLNLIGGQFLSQSDWGKLCMPENLVRIRVANPTEHPWIGERAFQGVICGLQHCGKLSQITLEDFQATRVETAKTFCSFDKV